MSNRQAPAQDYKQYTGRCAKCGAIRTDSQIGVEEQADCLGWATGLRCGKCFCCHMVDVFNDVKRVLRDDGTIWINLGDTFTDAGLSMVPARVALALQSDGWRMVQDIIWSKTNCMPESVKNRCTKSHEYFLLMSKSTDYYYDCDAIREEPSKGKPSTMRLINHKVHKNVTREFPANRDTGQNKLSVWRVPTRAYEGSHYAVFHPKLITPCILAGTSEHGCCADCGAPYERVVAKVGGSSDAGNNDSRDRSMDRNRNGINSNINDIPSRQTMGWKKVCMCRTNDVVPCRVLDPFSGTGTTVATSVLLGRSGVGIELCEDYIKKEAVPQIEAALRNEKPQKKREVVDYGAPPPVQRVKGT